MLRFYLFKTGKFYEVIMYVPDQNKKSERNLKK